MLVPKVRILITSKKDGTQRSFDYCVEGEIERNFEKITQTAKFIIPNTYNTINTTNSLRSQNLRITDLIKKGDKVSIFLRFLYNDGDRDKRTINPEVERFTGYISKVIPGYLATFECEDEMWLLKQTIFQGFQLVTPVTLTSLISYMQNISKITFPTSYIDQNGNEIQTIAFVDDLGTVQVLSGNTFADVLDFLKNKYLILCYFKNGALSMRRGNQFVASQTRTFYFNGPDTNITDKGSLEWQYIDDIRLMIKFTCQVMVPGKQDKKTTRYIYYDVSGVIRVAEFPPQGYNQIEHVTTNDLTISQITDSATQLLKSVTYTGYKGEFITFGEPVMDFGDRVNIVNKKFPELSSYDSNNKIWKPLLLRAVKTTFGNKGYFQHLNIYGQ